MIFVVDASVDYPIVTRLRADGHEVFSIREIEPRLSDPEVLDLAYRKGAVLVTSDKDFGELVQHRRLRAHGVVLLRLSRLRAAAKAELVSNRVRENRDRLIGRFVVFEMGSTRIRALLRSV